MALIILRAKNAKSHRANARPPPTILIGLCAARCVHLQEDHMQKDRVATTRTLPVPVIARVDRRMPRKAHAKEPLFIAVALFLAVSIANTILMVAPALTDLALPNGGSF
jgi:hypothetical protein